MLTGEVLMQNWSNYQNFAGQTEDFFKRPALNLGAGFGICSVSADRKAPFFLLAWVTGREVSY